MGMTQKYISTSEHSSLATLTSTSLYSSRTQLTGQQLNTSAVASTLKKRLKEQNEPKFIYCVNLQDLFTSTNKYYCVLAFWLLLLLSIVTQSTVSLKVDGE